MKGKKFILMSVVMLLVVALTAGTALAASPWIDKGNKGNKGNNWKVNQNQFQDKDCDFSDVSSNHWANKRIKAMAKQGICKGYGNGKFHPNASVSNIEALTMVVRLTEDYDNDALKDALDKDYDLAGIPLWAKGYAALAIDAEILDEEDLDNFRPNAAAKRYEVAILLGKALDIDPDDYEDDLKFLDKNEIPDEAMGYLAYMVDQGYLTGYKNGKLMPNKPVTRAELANILAKVNGDIEDDDDDIDINFKAQGRITEIDDDSFVLKIKNTEKEFNADSDVIVFLDNKDADYEDLEEGFKAFVLYDGNGDENDALVIYARSDDEDEDEDVDVDVDEDEDDEDIDEVEGILQSVDSDSIEILVDGDTEDYDLADDVEVEIDDEEDADLEDLLPGMEVELEVDEDDIVVGISAEDLDEIEGEFVSYDDDKDEVVVDIDGEDFTFDLAYDVDVEIDGDNAELEDLDDGMELQLTFEDGKVVKIEAEDKN